MGLKADLRHFIQRPGETLHDGMGFTPKIHIGMMNNRTADGKELTALFQGFGVGTDDFSERAASIYSEGGVSTVNTAVRHAKTGTSGYVLVANAAGLLWADQLVSEVADGFSSNPNGSDGGSRINSVLSLGGIDLFNYKIGSFAIPAATGLLDVTDPGFQPDLYLVWTSFRTTTESNSSTSAPGMSDCAGCACADGSQWVTALDCNDGTNPSDSESYQRTNACLAHIAAGAVTVEAAHSAMLSNGFRLNFTTVDGSQTLLHYLAIRGINAHAYSFNVGTVGSFSNTGFGFQPTCRLYMSVCRPASTAVQAHAIRMIGCAVDSRSQDIGSGYGPVLIYDAISPCVRVTTSRDNVDPTVCTDSLYRDRVIQTQTQAGVLLDTATFTSNDADGETLNCTVGTGNNKEILGLALGDKPNVIFKGGVMLGGKLAAG